jgi:NADPH:quinone reductase-like Zn-dependent oxidoreductase
MPKIYRFHQTGGPETLVLEEVPAREPGANEVLLRVEAIGINRAECAFRSGRYLERPKLPATLGYEAAGRILAVGAGVARLNVGDHVSVIPAFSMNDYGTYGEEVILPADAIVPCPRGLDSRACAGIWMQYLTAYGALVELGGLKAGEYVLITAASSSVGLAAIQIAVMLGARPIAVSRTAAKRQALLDAGAEHVLASSEQDLTQEVRAITGKAGVRIIFDPIAGPLVETLAKIAAPNAMIFVYGGLSAQPTPFPGGLAMLKGLTLRGYALFEITNHPERRKRAVEFVSQGIASGQLRPLIDETFEFAQMTQAHRYMEAGTQVGKIIVTVP